MKYVKPVVMANEEMAEGVFAGSGDCWTVGSNSVQDYAGSDGHVFEIWANHNLGLEHISSKVVYTITFSAPVSFGRSEFPSSVDGNVMTVTRELLADAYKSGDRVTFKVWANTGDEASTKALSITGITYKCTHTMNVQGKND